MSRVRRGGDLNQLRLRRQGRPRSEPGLQSGIADQFAHESRGSFVATDSLLSINVQRIFGSRHGHVEKAAFFLIVESLVIGWLTAESGSRNSRGNSTSVSR